MALNNDWVVISRFLGVVGAYISVMALIKDVIKGAGENISAGFCKVKFNINANVGDYIY